jgi:hypothetical protein
MKGFEIGAVNVVLHPHSPEIYEKWVKKVFRIRLRGHVHGNRHGAISQLYKTGAAEGVTLHGVISTFIHFDQNRPWFNEQTADDATPQDLGEISLPEHLRPDHRRGNFAFDSKRHLFLFDANPRKGGLTPKQMLHLLMQFSSDKRMISEFGPANMTVIPDSKAVDEILEWRKLKKIIISTSVPNPDFADAAFGDVEQWMKSQGAEVFRQELGSASADLKPSEETKNLARIASEHGYVEAVGLNENEKTVRLSTRTAKPLIHRDDYDPETEAETSAFTRIAQSLSEMISKRRRSLKRVFRDRE